MTRKNKKAKNDHSTEDESVGNPSGWTEAASGADEAKDSASESQGEAGTTSQASIAADDPSMDDLLDDVRRSLIEGDTEAEDKKPGWWDRLSKGRHKEQEPKQAEPTIVEEQTVSAPAQDSEYLEQIDELIEMLDQEDDSHQSEPALSPIAPVDDLPAPEPIEIAPPEPPVDLGELKKRVFQTRPANQAEENVTEVRSIALEGGEEVFVEVESAKVDPGQERLKAFENSLRPYRQYIYYATAALGLVMAFAVLVLMVRTLADSGRLTFLQPAVVETVDPNLPYPTSLALPGGLNFNLGQGSIRDGKWNPTGPEWSIGTEVCRWVAIPWSLQVEAVVRTFNQTNTIDLVMSNDDRLTYNVTSIQELTLEEMQALDQNSPCLLLVLAKQDSEKRWVVIAKP